MTAAVSFPKLAALADAPFSYRDELGRECREALSTIDRLRASSCTPAERALIDAAVALERCGMGPSQTECTLYPEALTFRGAVSTVLAERGEA